jgi:Domain of unknown function (DUF4815)
LGTNSLDTNFNQAPYWADYAANSEQYTVLFKPSVAVQARELNNLQFSLQNQIGSFSNNIFNTGSIISGCNINIDPNLAYVKLNDNYANGAAATVADFIGLTAVSANTGLMASVFSANQGFIAQAPFLNTLFIKYLNTGYAANTSNLSQNVAVSTFQQNEPITIFNQANIAIGIINVANNAVSGNSNTVGGSYAVSVDAGQIFQKGMALTVNKQSLVVSPYSNQPNGISVGFTSLESILTAFQDPLLNDNAQGAPNFAAPGADRLVITPTLTIINSAMSNNDFFAIIDFFGGQASIINQDTSFNTIGDLIATTSSDTNGDFIISPFNLSSQQAILANGSVDTMNFRLNVSSGNGYIDGRKLNLLSQIFTNVRRGTDVNFQSQQILTAQMGNWILVDQLYGTIDPTDLPTIGLLAGPSFAISNNAAKGIAVSAMVPSANIGTATLIGFEPQSAPGSPVSSGLLYLTNIKMNPGQSFINVGGVFCNNNSRQFFGDVQPFDGLFGVNQPQFAPLIYPLSAGGVQSLKTSANTRDTQFEFQVATGVSFNTSGQATLTIPSFSGGVNQLPFGVGNLTTTAIATDISVTAQANSAFAANLAGSFTAPAANLTLTGSGTSWNTQLWPGAIITLANSSASELKMVSSIANATSLTLVSPTVGSWTAGGNLHVTFLNGQILPLSVMANASVDVVNSTSMTISLGNAITPAMAANVYYPVERTAAAPARKTLQNSIWVAITCNNNAANTVGPWSLGVPDGYVLNHVYAGTTLSNTNPDMVNQFNLINGQTDTFYGLAQLASNGFVASSTTQLLVNFQAFLPNWTSGDGYFSVESYPIDDTGLTPNSIFTQNVPQYFSAAAQQTFDLRDSMDFRFYAANTIAYANTIATAQTNPNNTLTFNQTNITPVIPDSQVETSYSYFMGRYDQVGLQANGSIVFNEGTPSINPVPPGTVTNGMNLATIFIPPFPTLTQDLITPALSQYPYVTFSYTTNKRYQMKDIGALDQRLTQMEYYTALSALEQSVTNLLTSGTNGTSIFQNGIFADPLQNFALANCADPAFNIAIDSTLEVARPTFSQYPIALTYLPGSNTSLEGQRIIMLDPPGTTSVVFIQQPFASQIRNCAQDILYTYSGTVYLNPDGNYQPDVTVNPDVVANINDYQNFVSIADAWGTQWGTWNESSTTQTTGGIVGIVNPLNGIDDIFSTSSSTTTTTSSRSGTQLVATPVYNEVQLGTAITSISIQPFAPAALIEFQGVGLKPSTQHFVYMNDVPQSQFCFQTDPTFQTRINPVGTMVSDATGTLYGIYFLPAQTFNTGSLNFQILDIANNVTELNDIQSQASATYYATNLAYTENNLELQTVTGQLSQVQVSQSVTSQSTTSSMNLIFDPIGQTFSILSQLISDGSDCVFLESITLYFNSKDPVLGVTVQVRPLTSSGLPDQYCLPYGSVHLTSNQINTSQNSSVPTVVTFPDALLLETGSNYAFIVIPDGSNPNYTLWTGVIGATNVLGGQIYSLSATGVMIMSSQGITWTPYQNEAIKFSLNVLNYASAPVQGIASFVNDNSEFFNISNNFGTMNLTDPLVIANMTNNVIATSNATISSVSNNVITGNTTGLGPNTNVIITSTNNQIGYLTRVSSVINSTAFVATSLASANDTLASAYIANGNPTGFVADRTSNGSFLRVGGSTANSSNFMTNAFSYVILDTTTGAFSTGQGLFDMTFNTLMGKFAPTIPGFSSMTITAKTTSNATTGYVPDGAFSNLTIGISSDFLSAEKAVLSRSNEVQFLGGAKSLFINCNMVSNSIYQTPTLDSVKQAGYIVHNLVVPEDANNDVLTSEIQNVGTGLNRYISQTINLASGMSAENLTVYVGAHWPAGCEVYVYAKLLNQYDPGTWQSKVWSPLTTQNTYRASPVNLTDFTDYQFNFSNTVMTNGTAYNDSGNSGIVTYQSGGVNYADFVTFAVKVVLLSNNSPTVPMITDLRAVATTSAT